MDFVKYTRNQWDRIGAWLCVLGGAVALLVGYFGVSGTLNTAPLVRALLVRRKSPHGASAFAFRTADKAQHRTNEIATPALAAFFSAPTAATDTGSAT